MKLQDKCVLLTGASGGIGYAIAKALDIEGCQLLLTGRNQEKLQGLLNTLSGNKHQILCADLTLTRDRQQLLTRAKQLDCEIIINGLGVNQLSLLTQATDSQIEEMMVINLQIPIQLCRGFIPLLNQKNDPTIVNIGSILGSIGYAGSTLYCSSKFGLRGFTESLRRELADTNIRVIYFAPRATNTELNNQKNQAMNQALGNQVDEPSVVANTLVHLLKQKRAVTYYLGWPEKLFVRLNSLFPRLVDKALLKQLPIIRRFTA
ncbi:SDR family oxidoreductase [Shewanella surugensis]|uniref:SDR family oxidoreductase n=1 Tax=Shewanella surugensis TaxID=212020 RepID=A0ABT0L9G3_9GAMM|nr:SDR family oxidoreductase [Shewanella surugensis]MCL1124354.1 SDR family oxidoreductase [Shewanella surugensis]